MANVFKCPYSSESDGATFIVRIRMGEIVKYVSSHKNSLRFLFQPDIKKRYALILEELFKEKPLLKKMVLKTALGSGNYSALITRLIDHGA